MRIYYFFNKLIFTLNILFGALLLLACLAPYIPTDVAPFVAFFSISIPMLVLVNALFVLFWQYIRKGEIALSLSALLIFFFLWPSFFMFRLSGGSDLGADLKVMTYNVRSFNRYQNIKDLNVFEEILDLITKEAPDIICFQEFDFRRQKQFVNYKYRYLEYIRNPGKVKLGFYSKYPIINKGLINFPESSNNAAFVDIVFKNDTLRVYNLHLESLRIIPDQDAIVNEESAKLYKRLAISFKKQQEQAEIITAHRQTTRFKTIICGDFNSTQYSNIYKIIKGDSLQDTFQEKGTGYGSTYNFKYYPLRIDFILVDQRLKVLSHKNYEVKLSDHFPVLTSLKL